jgi:hypothetical protein
MDEVQTVVSGTPFDPTVGHCYFDNRTGQLACSGNRVNAQIISAPNYTAHLRRIL